LRVEIRESLFWLGVEACLRLWARKHAFYAAAAGLKNLAYGQAAAMV